MTPPKPAPRVAWIAGLLLSLAMAGLLVVSFLAKTPSGPTAWILPPLLVAVGAFAFALAWPAGSWRWGILMSAGFAAFFLAVFLSYASISDWEGVTLVRAATVVVAGLAGSAIATRFRRTPD